MRVGPFCAAAGLLCLPLLADALRVASVDPPRGQQGEATEVTLQGEGFAAGSRISLLGGGPFLAGSHFMPDGARGVEITGSLACVAFYDHASKLGGIRILDVSDPAEPARVGAFETGDSGVDVQVSGTLAYIAFLNPYTYLGGLHIVDVSDPTDPLRVGTFDTFLDPQRIALAGRYVYVAAGEEGLKIIDVGHPASPLLAGGYETPGPAMDIEIADEHAYVADRAGLRVIDISDPASPVLKGSLEVTDGTVVGLAVSGTHLYAADASGAFLVIDIADPTSPALIKKVPLADAATGVVVSGRYAYVAAGYSGLQIVDVGDPDDPRVVGGRGLFGNSGYFYSVAVFGRRAIVADIINGVHVLDVSAPAAPALAGSLDIGSGTTPGTGAAGNPLGVAVSGGVAYLAGREDGLLAIDVTDPSAPLLIGSVGTPGLAQDVAVSDRCAYVADGMGGLVVIDADGLGRVGSLDTPGDAQGIVVSGGFAYVADGSRGLAIIDVRDPHSPFLAGVLDTPGSARDVTLSGGFAYVADDFRGLQIVDVTRPDAPVLAGKYDTPGRAMGVSVAGDRAYVADLNRGLQILDVAAPASPILVANVSTPGAATGVAIAGETLYVADGFSGLLEIDVHDPAKPIVIGRYDTPVSATGVTLSDGRAYVTDDGRGLRIIRPNPPLPPPTDITPAAIIQTVPSGVEPGPYDIELTGPQGATQTLRNGFTVCGKRRLDARLHQVSPLRWRLQLDGDSALLEGASPPRARLLLPRLPSTVEVRPTVVNGEVDAAGPGKAAINLWLFPDASSGIVFLIGPDAADLESLWNKITEAGSIDLPRHDDGSFGELRLAIHGQAPNGRGEPQPPERYRYEFAGGRLIAATAWGAETDVRFEVDATDGAGCETKAFASFKAALRETWGRP